MKIENYILNLYFGIFKLEFKIFKNINFLIILNK